MAIIGWLCMLIGAILLPAIDCPVFIWWVIAFQALIDIGVSFTVLQNDVRLYRSAWLALLAVATSYSTSLTSALLWKDDTAAAVVSAGAILISIVNLLWILFLGTSSREPAHRFIASFARAKTGGTDAEAGSDAHARLEK